MNFQYAKLKGKIVEQFGSQEKFAVRLQCAPMTVNRKLNGQSTFTREDMVVWSALLNIKRDDIPNYFFE